jgi:hypothetical protein
MKHPMKRLLSHGLAVVLVLTGMGTLFGGPATAAPTVTDPAVTPTYGTPSITYSGAGQPPTADKPQSKLWWNDGKWWANMWTTGSGWHIYQLDRGSKTWVSTGVKSDTRANTRSDTLWDGKYLYIASHVVTNSSETSAVAALPNQPARLFRYSYANGKYTLDSGFPATIATKSSESMTIDRDSTGKIWATWTEVAGDEASGFTSNVYMNHSAPGGGGWATPSVLPVENPKIAPDDISAVVAFNKKQVGIMWTDHLTGSVFWATHNDGQSATSWKVQSAVRGKGAVDDHLNLKSLHADNAGRVYAAVKTSYDVTPGSSPTAPQTQMLVFKPGTGAFSVTTISTIGDCVTRPQVVLDTTNNVVHVFHTAPQTSVTGCAYSGSEGSIYHKSASLDNPVFAAGRGTPVIQDKAHPNINNVTTSKQTVNSTTGLVILASDNVTKRYWYADVPLGGPYKPPAKSPFTDVTAGQMFYNEIYWVADKGISTGYPEADGSRTYRPLLSVNRDAMAAFMYRLAGKPDFTPPAVSPFSDVPVGTQFYKEITWLAKQEISTGYPDGTYRPLQSVNRDAMAAFMYRLAGKPDFTPPAVSPFTDVPVGAQFYKEITWLAKQEISTGYPDGTYRPLQPVNRDAMAAFMYRYNSYLGSL